MQDNNHKYNVNDTYPRKGFDVLPSRIKELSTSANRQKTPLIAEVKDDTKSDKRQQKKSVKNI